MDAVSYSLASKQAQRIEKFIENPDSTSGIVTVPKTIASGETVTVPAGRVAVLPNVQVDGVLNIKGEVFVPSGATFGDLENQIAVKADTSYVNTQLGLKQNVLVANDSAVKTALNATGTAPIYACRAWVNFNGTGTVAIRASGNVSSITDNGVNDYTINFTIAMPDKYYTLSGAAQYNQDNLVASILSYRGHPSIDNYILTTSCRIATKMENSSGNSDPADCLAISASFTR